MALEGVTAPRPDRLFVRHGTFSYQTTLNEPNDPAFDGPTRLLDPGPDKVGKNTDLNQVLLRRLLERHGIDSSRAMLAMRTSLRLWEPTDVEPVLRQLTLRGRNHNPCGPELSRYPGESGTGKLLRLVPELGRYVKAPATLVRQSIQQQAALCVNRDGKFQVMKSGYSVMSHAWEETMGWSDPQGSGKLDSSARKKGIYKSHFAKFFNRCGATWLWVDALAMPEIFEDMDPAQKTEAEFLRIGVINNIASIFRQADKVVVLDTLALQLSTGSLIDVAVVLSLGRWIRRMWTVAEARLGKKVFVKTADGEADLDEIVSLLEEEAVELGYRFGGLLRTLSILRRKPTAGATAELSDLVKAYRHTHTEDAVDRVRAAFPLLGLMWGAGWSQEEGMLHLIRQMPTESVFLAQLYGERGLPGPYHAMPSVLNQLCGHMHPGSGLQFTEAGVAGRRRCARVFSFSYHMGAGTQKDPMAAVVVAVAGAAKWEIEVQVLTDHDAAQLERAARHGVLRLLFPEDGELFNFLLVSDNGTVSSDEVGQTAVSGAVLGSGLCALGEKDSCRLQAQTATWILS
ncbi:hypothetical protein CDEST_04369 [Colletotrichum destructivum]|uniref:Uncharacterized protein n=1 Tax=Colletotrichum destructivum TaxID=34406 RepID=A0AAX4I7T2_9PEZI|nr:hypothetical protein CDEST_04369 [Colletotrichum destructivum]